MLKEQRRKLQEWFNQPDTQAPLLVTAAATAATIAIVTVALLAIIGHFYDPAPPGDLYAP